MCKEYFRFFQMWHFLTVNSIHDLNPWINVYVIFCIQIRSYYMTSTLIRPYIIFVHYSDIWYIIKDIRTHLNSEFWRYSISREIQSSFVSFLDVPNPIGAKPISVTLVRHVHNGIGRVCSQLVIQPFQSGVTIRTALLDTTILKTGFSGKRTIN